MVSILTIIADVVKAITQTLSELAERLISVISYNTPAGLHRMIFSD